MEGLLQRPLASIYEGNASALRVLGVVGPEGFRLRDRALHVYSEAGRVYGFRDVCKVRVCACACLCIRCSVARIEVFAVGVALCLLRVG